MRNTTTIVNGLTAGSLITSQAVTGNDYESKAEPYCTTVYWSWDVIVRHADTSETVIGTKVAIMSRPTNASSGMQSANWLCPGNSLLSTDAIRISAFVKFDSGSWQAIGYGANNAWITPQLGATFLTQATWTFYAYTATSIVDLGEGYLYWGTTTYNTRIEGFTWSTTTPFSLYGKLLETNDSHTAALNVTCYYKDSTYETFEVDSGLTETPYYFFNSSAVKYFQWDVGLGLYRHYSPIASGETIYLYVPETTAYSYNIFVQCFGNITTNYTPLKTLLMVNGVLKVIESYAISNIYQVPIVCVPGRTYLRRITMNDGTLYEDTFTPNTLTATDVMVIKPISFSSQVQGSFSYVRMEATRPLGNTVSASYSDTLGSTTSFAMYVYNENMSLVYQSTVLNPLNGRAQISWDGANETFNYRVRMAASHANFGTLTAENYLLIAPTYHAPFDLSWMGTQYSWLPTLIPYSIILIVAGVFSTLTAGVGMLAMVAVAGVLYLIGWLPLTPYAIILALAIVVLYFMRKKERGEIGS